MMATSKEEMLERVLMPNQRNQIDGGLRFDKGRILWLYLQSSVSYLQDQVYSQSDESISLSSYPGNTLDSIFLHTLLRTHCTFCEMYIIENSQFIAEQRVRRIPVITMVLLAGSVGWRGHSDFLQDEG